MTSRPALILTSISRPNAVLQALAAGAVEAGFDFIVIGDTKSPADFALEGCDFFSVERQLATRFEFARICPTRHYARKNIGYLLAIERGAPLIVETDDDNFPRAEFWQERAKELHVPVLENGGWTNVYRYFSDSNIWPRGLPLDELQSSPADYASLPLEKVSCPIQQGLADENPDVDAIYRLVLSLPQDFRSDRRIALGTGTWCPFNSQNTTWWPETYPLLYLPAHCSFRMTDIWRSFVAQRIAWENKWSILFHEPTVWQDRNDHYLMRDFADEVPGYLNNRAMGAALADLDLKPGVEYLGDNLRVCYRELVEKGWVGEAELELLDRWLEDLASLR
jgi:hypothetical protein